MKNREKFFYGRARRIELAKKIIGIVLIVLVLVIFIYFISTRVKIFDRDVEYSYLINYFEKKGYNCQMIHKSGGTCVFVSDDTKYTFVRYDEGFTYVMRNDSYNLEFKHYIDSPDSIIFKTGDTGFAEVRNKYYYCTTDNSVIGNLKECVTSDGEKLELDAYIGVVEKGIYELNGILNASHYDVDSIINDYSWIKK